MIEQFTYLSLQQRVSASLIMDLVTGAMGSLLPKLAELLNEEYKLHKGVRKKVSSLSRELDSVHVTLRKVAQVLPEQVDEQVRNWACEVREVSYEMEEYMRWRISLTPSLRASMIALSK